MGIPFIPVRGILGSDLLRVQPRLKVITCPFSGHEVVAVEAIRPDVAVVHAYAADSKGNVCIHKHSDVDLAVRAAHLAIATVEEVVEEGRLTLTPNSRILSWINFHAIVPMTSGAHPTGCPGRYDIDESHVRTYLRMAQGDEGFEAYLRKYVSGPASEGEYAALVKREASLP